VIRSTLAFVLAAVVLGASQVPSTWLALGWHQEARRYLLYDIPAAEGFNLRRDVLTRALLLTEDLGSGWTLVLPPFHRMFHWRNDEPGDTMPWRAFLDLSRVSERVPLIEFADYVRTHGARVDRVLHLVTGPLDDKGARLEARDCAALPPFGPRFFGGTTTIDAAARECRFLLAPYRALEPVLAALPGDSVLVDGLQIGYWDDTYGGARYWAMRERMQFAAPLVREADRFIASAFGGTPYLAVHVRRGDFLATPRPHPSLDDVVGQVAAAQKRTGLTRLFLATDGSDADVAYLRARLTFARYTPPAGLAMTDGGIAILDQIVATRAAHFIGTEGSTFTRVIMEDREIAGRDPASTYDVLCKGEDTCPPSARFPRPASMK